MRKGLSILESLTVLIVCSLLIVVAGPVLLTRLGYYTPPSAQGLPAVTLPTETDLPEPAPIPKPVAPVAPKLPGAEVLPAASPKPLSPAPAPDSQTVPTTQAAPQR